MMAKSLSVNILTRQIAREEILNWNLIGQFLYRCSLWSEVSLCTFLIPDTKIYLFLSLLPSCWNYFYVCRVLWLHDATEDNNVAYCTKVEWRQMQSCVRGSSQYVEQQLTVQYLLGGSFFHVLWSWCLQIFLWSWCICRHSCKEYDRPLHMFLGLCCP